MNAAISSGVSPNPKTKELWREYTTEKNRLMNGINDGTISETQYVESLKN